MFGIETLQLDSPKSLAKEFELYMQEQQELGNDYKPAQDIEQFIQSLEKAKKFAPEDTSIAEEKVMLNKLNLAALLVSTPQTLFGKSNTDSQSNTSKANTVQEASCQFKFN